MEKAIKHITRPELKDILSVQSAVLKSIHDFMWNENITQLMPVMLSPFTDPLAHSVHECAIQYDGQRLELTKSMILHKQLSMLRDDIKGIYIISPNIRLEKSSKSQSSRHLFEFSQVDIELKDADHKQFMRFLERLYVHVFSFVKMECREELKRLGRELPELLAPFTVYESSELKKEFGDDWEHKTSMQETRPFWVMDHYREFYDKEDPISKRHINYDIVYPEGFGEGLSGAERETDYETIIKKMAERKTDQTSYATYLEIAKKGILRPTAGGGFGVERLVRYLTGKKEIRDVCLFPRVPGRRL